VINEDFLDLALNAFVNLQLETYHIKEPYIGYSAYRRIEQAMIKCLQKANPHVFYHNLTTQTGPADEYCEEHLVIIHFHIKAFHYILKYQPSAFTF